MNRKTAERIVNAVLDNLEGRSGFDVINVIIGDEDVYKEMYDSLVHEVQRAAQRNDDPTTSRFYTEIDHS